MVFAKLFGFALKKKGKTETPVTPTSSTEKTEDKPKFSGQRRNRQRGRRGRKPQSLRSAATKSKAKEILISLESDEYRVALLEDKILEEFFIERGLAERMLGNIYRGRIKSIVKGIRAAFVDIGTSRDGFLYIGDTLKSPLDDDLADEDTETSTEDLKKKEANLNIEDVFKIGQEVVVQVVKEPIRGKGPRLTTRFTVPSRNLVLMPGEKRFGISRKIDHPKERDRLRKIMRALPLPKDAGFIVRTAATGKSKEEFERDLAYLTEKWEKIKVKLAEKSNPPVTIHSELTLVERVIRDFLTEDTASITVDDQELYQEVRGYLERFIPEAGIKVIYHDSNRPLFDTFGIEAEMAKIYQRKVNLACGGHLVIEQTEALVSIDVNTGKYAGKENLEETAFKTNCDAADVIARQIRLRDLGGIIVIDFIDMEEPEHRREVLRRFRDAVRRDRAKINTYPISELGLIEMTRQRVRPSLERTIYETCSYCDGKGTVKSAATMAIEVIKQIRKKLQHTKSGSIQASVHPAVAERLMHQDSKVIKDIEEEHKKNVLIVANPSLHNEDVSFELF